MTAPQATTSNNSAPETAEAVLELRGITAGYGDTTVLRDVSLTVEKGTIVALLGANGAGKTTTLRIASGLLRPSAGQVLIKGTDATRHAPHQRTRAGLCLIPEGRGIFRSLTVRENLTMHTPPWIKGDLDRVLQAFPILGERLRQNAGTLSGGQQQMLALARAYLAEPDVILLDEVSMGLAPVVVDQIFETIHDLAQAGVALVIVEQYVNRALDLAQTVNVLNRGEITFSGPADSLDQEALAQGYLGAGNGSEPQTPQ